MTSEPTAATTARADGRQARSPGVRAALSVVELLVTEGPLGLVDLARRLALPKSTLHRICAILVERGWAVRDAQGSYEPGVRAIGLGQRAGDLPIVSGFRHAVPDLMSRHDETVGLAVLDGDETVYIALEETTQPVRLVTWVGRRTPAFASASGRVLLADRPPDAVAALFGGGGPLVTPTRAAAAVGGRAARDPRARAPRRLRREPRGDRPGALHRVRPRPQQRGQRARGDDDLHPDIARVARPPGADPADLRAAGERMSAEVGWLSAYHARAG